MNECRGYDDAGTEVLGDEEGPVGDTDAFMAGGVDGEAGACGGDINEMFTVRCNTRAGIPKSEPIRMTKIAEMRTPVRPSNSLPGSQATAVSAAAEDMIADGATCLAMTRVTSCKVPTVSMLDQVG